MDRFVDDGSLDDNVESFLSPDDADPRDRVGRSAEVGKGMIYADFLHWRVLQKISILDKIMFHNYAKWFLRFDNFAVTLGFTFTEFQLIPASTSKVESCHFSPDGKLLATGGHDKKVRWVIAIVNELFFESFNDVSSEQCKIVLCFQNDNVKFMCLMIFGAGCVMVHGVFYGKVYTWGTYSMDNWCPFQSKPIKAGYIFSW